MKNNLFVLTWPPCSGKTTLIQELWKRGYDIVPEIQMQVIAEYKARLWSEEAWKNWLKPNEIIDKGNFTEFMSDCIDRQIEQEEAVYQNNTPTILDRSGLDGLSFLELRNISNTGKIQAQVSNHIEKIWGYAWVFSLSILQSEFQKRQQNWRVISLEEAQHFADINRAIYRWSLDIVPIEFISRRNIQKDAKSISEAITTIMSLGAR